MIVPAKNQLAPGISDHSLSLMNDVTNISWTNPFIKTERDWNIKGFQGLKGLGILGCMCQNKMQGMGAAPRTQYPSPVGHHFLVERGAWGPWMTPSGLTGLSGNQYILGIGGILAAFFLLRSGKKFI